MKMTKLKHTPGPLNPMYIDGTMGNLNISTEEEVANVRLFSTAPEMLEWMIIYYVENIALFGCYHQEALISIIEKATGLNIEEILK